MSASRIIGVQIICAGLAIFGAAQAATHAPAPAHTAPAAPRSAAQVKALVQEYVAAAGIAGLRAVRTRSCQGEVELTPSSLSSGEGISPFHGRVELDWMAPGRAREVWTSGSAKTRRISDGDHGWEVGTAEARRELHQAERVELSRLAELYQPAIVLPLDELAFSRGDKVGERAAWVLQTQSGELLWLDQETHLPLRVDLLVERREPSRAGEFYLSQIFFEDWQPVVSSAPGASNTAGPILLPRTVRRVLAQATLVYRFDDMKQDLELSTGLFKIPYFWRK